MTRLLSELLGAQEPTFSLNLQQLEKSAGRPSADIRLSTKIMHGMQAKLQDLGLDSRDTKGPELYAALGERLRHDETRFAAALKGKSTKTTDPIAHVAVALSKTVAPSSGFALKATVAKRLLKANLPKKTMKLLGYRSVDSMLKHESAASIYAAAALIEADGWTKKQFSSYSKLKASDFEIRPITIEHPSSKRWTELAESVVSVKRRSVLGFKELAAVVLLPLPAEHHALPTLATSVLALQAINEIRAASTYLKLHQVGSGFGSVVRQVVAEEPILQAQMLDQKVSWNMVQQYYARFAGSVRSDVFEPVVQAEDLAWHNVEDVLTHIEPSLEFWQETGFLALLHDGKAVSCNLADQIFSHCNALPFERRISNYFKHAVLTELSMLYMTHDRLEETVASAFQKQLAMEPATA